MSKRRIKYMNLASKKSIKTGFVSQLVEYSSFLGSSRSHIFLENLSNKYASNEDLFEII